MEKESKPFDWKKVCCSIALVVGLVAGIFGLRKEFVTQAAHAELKLVVAKVDQRLDNKIKSDQIMAVRAEIAQIERMYEGKKMPAYEWDRLQRLRQLLYDLTHNK